MNEELKREIATRKKEAKEKLRLEKKLLQANKMEALGTLAGGVAHDLNNILSGIVSYPDLLLMDVEEDSPLRKPIQTIKRSGEKAATIVQDLLTLARRGVAVQEIVNLNDVIIQYLNSPEFNLLKVENSKVFIDTDLAGNLFNIKGSPVHLSKSVMNLISNAMEAMPDGGRVTIKTENKYIDLPLERYDDIEEGDYVSFSISDNGVGISSDDLNRIFEPFYTKKVMGRSGTGLGMAVVWGTVKDHQGYIDIQSIEGKGTEFKIYFPVTRQHETDAKVQLSFEELKGNGQSVLIVDDIADQREIAKAILSKLGYQAAAVASGEDALEYLKKNETDLLILDMIMEPGMDGLEAYREIIKFRPKQKAIIASGFSETERVKEAQRLGAGLYLKKPYNLGKIGAAVKEEISRSGADHA
jgi:nitrogen-specific signal transduction histidine kinase/ActR/RegA family two-component response regulator